MYIIQMHSYSLIIDIIERNEIKIKNKMTVTKYL